MKPKTHSHRRSLPTKIASYGQLLVLAASLVHFGSASASASERIISTADGDVAVAYPSRDELAAQQGIAAENLPFASREERLAVKPMEWYETEPQYSVDTPEALEALDKPAGSASGGDADPSANDIARAEYPAEWEAIDTLDKSLSSQGPIVPKDGTHGVFTRYLGNGNTQMWKFAPFNKIGKLYFTTPNGGSSYCTANVVTGKSHIVTAAHCVYTRGQGFNRNFVFVPAERNGAAPYGQFGWSAATVPGGWLSNGGRRWDVGLIRLRNDSKNRPVTFYVGWLGRSWNFPYTQHLHSFGYASNLSTQVTNICAAQSFFSGQEGTDVLVKGCDMTFGSSGGGWLRNYRPYSHGGNSVNGVVSGPHIGAFGTTYVGPRFSSANIVPLCNTLGC